VLVEMTEWPRPEVARISADAARGRSAAARMVVVRGSGSRL
jgi:hypothetical protein